MYRAQSHIYYIIYIFSVIYIAIGNGKVENIYR